MGNRRELQPIRLPPIPPPVRNILIGLIGLYVVEMVVGYAVPGGDIIWQVLPWTPSLDLSLFWQPLTHFLVQHNNVLGVLLGAVVVYFFGDWFLNRFTSRTLLTILGMIVAGCVAVGLLWSGLAVGLSSAGLLPSASWLAVPALGWSALISGLVAVWCLDKPQQQGSLMFVVPMKGITMLWILIAITAVFFLVGPTMFSVEPFGAIGGAAAWWYFFGGGARTQRLKKKGKEIERELKFTVYEGGRQGDQDEWIN